MGARENWQSGKKSAPLFPIGIVYIETQLIGAVDTNLRLWDMYALLFAGPQHTCHGSALEGALDR